MTNKENTIRWFWNGFKIGKGKLIKCNIGEGTDLQLKKHLNIRPTNYEYFPAEIDALFQVKNRTDYMIDYFDKDKIEIYPDHPLYSELSSKVNTRLKKRAQKRRISHD